MCLPHLRLVPEPVALVLSRVLQVSSKTHLPLVLEKGQLLLDRVQVESQRFEVSNWVQQAPFRSKAGHDRTSGQRVNSSANVPPPGLVVPL